MEVNGAFATNMIVHNSLTQSQNMLKFLIYASYVNIYYIAYRKMMLGSGKTNRANSPFKY